MPGPLKLTGELGRGGSAKVLLSKVLPLDGDFAHCNMAIFLLHLTPCTVTYDARGSFASVTEPNELFGGEYLLKKTPQTPPCSNS